MITIPRTTLLLALLLSFHHLLSAQQIAVTWDDLPAHGSLPTGETRARIASKVIAGMKSQKLPPAYGFINGSQTAHVADADEVFRLWIDSGNLLGNHTWSHLNLSEHSSAQFEADVEQNEPLLTKWMGTKDWQWLRYPYLAEGKSPDQRDEIRAYLAKRNYRVAAVTMGFPDYEWAEPYARCVNKHDAEGIEKLEANYLQSARDAAVYSRKMAFALYGKDIPYVLLLHIGPLDSEMLPQLLALYKRMGFTFTTLEKAESDPFYQADINLNTPGDAPILETTMGRQGLKPPAAPIFQKLDSLCQ